MTPASTDGRGQGPLRDQTALLLFGQGCAPFRFRDQGAAGASRGHAEPDYAAIREYLVFQYVLGEETFFRGVRKLPPGTIR